MTGDKEQQVRDILTALLIAERHQTAVKGMSRTEKACHKAAADAYRTALDVLDRTDVYLAA